MQRPAGDVRQIGTFGNISPLDELLGWAQRKQLHEPLALVLDGTRCASEPQFIGTVLAYLRQKVPFRLLREWDLELPFLAGLHSLAEACAVSTYIYEHHHAMPAEHRLAEQLRDGELGTFPLIALIARPIHAQDETTAEWIAALRFWCFIQFMAAIHSGAQPNAYLIYMISKLRLGIDRKEKWLELFVRLRGPTSSFLDLTRHLSREAFFLLQNTAAPVSAESHKKMLKQLQHFCEGKQPRITAQTDGDDYGSFYRKLLQTRMRRELPSHWAPSPTPRSEFQQDEDTKEVGILNLDQKDDDSETWIVADIDATDTPPEQEHKVGAVRLASVEDSQLLPFSWNRPNPHERAALKDWMASALASLDEGSALLAATVYLAVHTARSLRTVLALEISSQTDADWRVDLAKGCLHRHPPRRYNGWRVDERSSEWVRPCAPDIQLELPVNVRTILQRRWTEEPSASCVEDLLIPNIEAPDFHFRNICQTTKGLQRITSGMLSHWLEQSAYEQSADAVLSQLVASQPRSGLPGACAYASFGLDQVRSVLQVTQTPSPADRGAGASDLMALNAAGSELSPIEALLRRACADARDKVNALASDPTRWVEHHNCLTAYVTLCLLAATGVRPVSSPFESLLNIDLDAGVIYGEDKVYSLMHQGRLIPLAPQATELLRLHYLPHLKRLSLILAKVDSALSQVILDHSQGQANSTLPLLFFISKEPELDWYEVSEASLSALELFAWPLPWNLMRHRLPTELRQLGVNPEITNGLSGHGEQGTAAYGPFSTRIWQQDAQSVLPNLELLMQRLELTAPQAAHWDVELAAPVPRPTISSTKKEKRKFGARARQEQRKQKHARVVELAEEEIKAFVDDRPLDSLAPQEWEKLSQRMLLTPLGMPQTMGTLRYETLMRWINRQWAEKHQQPRLKRRYIPYLEEPSPFTQASIGAPGKVYAARAALDSQLSTMTPSRVSQRDGMLMAALSLLLHSRISDIEVLGDALTSRNCRVLSFAGNAYLFHAQGLERLTSAAGRRFRIHPTTARWLDSVGYRLDVRQRALPASLQPIALAAGLTNGTTATALQCIEQIAQLVEQCNAQQLPGVVCAYLSGKIVTAALPLADWMRVERGYAVQIPAWPHKDAEVESQDKQDAEAIPISLTDPKQDDYVFLSGELASGSGQGPVEKRQAQIAARQFFQAIRSQLNDFAGRKQSHRRDLDAALRRVLSEHDQTSRSCRLLGEWLRSMLWRRTRRSYLSLRSMLRYLNALSVCFEAIAYDHDLLDCDSDGVTDFYQRVMATRRSIHPEAGDALPPSAPPSETDNSSALATGTANRRYRTWRLALVLLRDFHRLVSREMSVEDPEWQEIDAEEDALSISPGIVLEKEYLHALKLAAADPQAAHHEQLACAFILLACYRFGLRGAEATGLMRDDWITTAEGTVVVLVRRTPVRALKTQAAMRQIPLIFELHPLESQILERFFALWEGIAQGNPKIPLLADTTEKGSLLNEKLLRSKASRLIKQATLNDTLSLHHLRHSFANRIGKLLLDGADEIWPHLESQAICPVQRDHARKLLLCTTEVTRRSLWALARLLGHAHPTSTVRNYLHLLPELSDRLIWSDTSSLKPLAQQGSETGLNLDPLQARGDYLAEISPPVVDASPPRPSAQAVLRFLRLYQNGTAPHRAAFSTVIHERDGEQLIRMLEKVDQTLARRSHINPFAGGKSTLLGHVSDQRWQDLTALAEGFRLPPPQISPLEAQATPCPWHESLLEIIGPSRQLLLHKKEHFAFLRWMLQAWHLDSSCLVIHASKGLHEKVKGWACEFKFPIQPFDSPNRPQIDTAWFMDLDPPTRVVHRCAALPTQGRDAVLKSSFEMVLLTLVSIFMATSSTDQSASSKSLGKMQSSMH